jgi:hypothetical protein
VSFIFWVIGVIENIYIEEISTEIRAKASETDFMDSDEKSKKRNEERTICKTIQMRQFSSSQ